MSAAAVLDQSRQPHARVPNDSRPPGRVWAQSAQPAHHNQPSLAFEAAGSASGKAPNPSGHRVFVVASPWWQAQPSTLPDARTWSASLALALAETLQGQRPVGQLTRWVDDQVLATVTVSLRQRRPPGRATAAPVQPVRLRSVHLQHPQPKAVETSAHVQIGDRSTAFAFRLEAWYDRWLCTALELGPRQREV